MRPRISSYLLVTIQFVCIGLLLWLGLFPLSAPEVLGLAAGILLGLLAITTMKLGNFSITPEPLPSSRLVTRGIYSLIRHPMYSAVLVIGLSCAINSGTIGAYVIWLLLLCDLIVKLYHEERLLRQRFADYAEYMKRTKRLVPFLW